MIQRLSLEEVQEVARLAAQRRTVVYGNGATLDRVADALGLSSQQVESLLAEVRDRQAGLLPPERKLDAEKLKLAGVITVAVLAVLLVVNLVTGAFRNAAEAARTAAPVAVGVTPERFAPVASNGPVPVREITPNREAPIEGGLPEQSIAGPTVVIKDEHSDANRGMRPMAPTQER